MQKRKSIIFWCQSIQIDFSQDHSQFFPKHTHFFVIWVHLFEYGEHTCYTDASIEYPTHFP